MERLIEALGPLLGARISVAAHGGLSVAVELDGGSGGSLVGRAAPWLPSLSERKDLTRTADNIAHLVHDALTEQWIGVVAVGPASPTVAAVGDVLSIRFFGPDDEPLPVVEVALDGQRA